MLKILIIDDTPEKIERIEEELNKIENVDYILIDKCADIATAQNKVSENKYDILLLDLFIPKVFGEKLEPQNALDFLNYLRVEDEIFKPYFVIGITKFQDIDKYKASFGEHLYYLLNYDEINDTWKTLLKNKIKYLDELKNKIKYDPSYDYDVAFITALQTPELEQLMKVNGYDWKEHTGIENDKTTVYYTTTIKNHKGKEIRVVAAYADQMGMCASALLATKLIYTFHPRYLIMTGICASASTDDVQLGDIIVANQTWNAASGKIKDAKEDGPLFLPDPHYETLEPQIKTIVDKLKTNSKLLFEIANSYPSRNGVPPFRMSLHCGDSASVPAVVACEEIIDMMKTHQRKLIGLEMESYGVYYAAKHSINPVPIAFSIKAASDGGNEHKSDNYQEYCAYVSAKFAFHLVENELSS